MISGAHRGGPCEASRRTESSLWQLWLGRGGRGHRGAWNAHTQHMDSSPSTMTAAIYIGIVLLIIIVRMWKIVFDVERPARRQFHQLGGNKD